MSFKRWLVSSMIGTASFAALMARPASASVIWRGDFSTGNIKQWSGTEMVSSDRLQVVEDPLGSGTKVLKVTVRKGDDPINSSGNRNELIYTDDDVGNGQADRYYHWRTMWPTDYSSENTWQLFTQWHQYDGGGSPPVEFFVKGEQVNLRILKNGDQAVWSVPLQRGVWHDFVFHVRWSSNPSVGFIELWYDGRQVLSKTTGATMFGSDGVYLKQGLYRDEAISAAQNVFHTGMVVGTTLDDVWPAEQPSTSPDTPTSDETPSNTETPGAPRSGESATDTPASAAEATVSKLKGKAGCSQPGAVGLLGFLPVAMGLVRRRSSRRGVTRS